MMNKSKIRRFLSLGFVALGFMLISGSFTGTNAQQTRDPFDKPGWATPKSTTPSAPGTGNSGVSSKPAGPPPIEPVKAPPIEQRIEYYKRQRLYAAENGQPIPKVTTVLTLEEMAITGIFRTPRGYAAMVEATPIKLSYTIYPGEKFFDGQLVAVEENRLVFRKVTKMSDGKFIASVENKALRQYSDVEQIQGTAPIQPSSGQPETAKASPVPSKENKPASSGLIISPLEEMNRQSPEEPKDSAKDKKTKKGKKPVRVAKKKGE